MAQPLTQPLTLRVEGMTCGGCARSVERVLRADPAVEDVLGVSHQAGTAELLVRPDRLDRARLAQALGDAGFELGG